MSEGSDALHEDALHVLRRWSTDDAGQEALRRAYVEHLERHPDGARRDGAPDHLTASCLVVGPGAGRVLLVLHAKVGLWLQPGGHLEPGDRGLAAAALRETSEETGLPVADLRLVGDGPARLDRHAAPCDPGRVRHHLDVQYVAVAERAGSALARSVESHDVGWFDPQALPEPTDDAVRALVARAGDLTGQSTSLSVSSGSARSDRSGPSRTVADSPSR